MRKDLDVLLIPYELAEGMQATKEADPSDTAGASRLGVFIWSGKADLSKKR